MAASTPTINANTNILFTNVATLTITGTGFDANGTNVPALTWPGNVAVPSGSVVVDSSTRLTVPVTLTGGPGVLNAMVTVDEDASETVQIATVLPPQTPLIITPPGTPPSLAQSAAMLVINGYGFTSAATVALTGNTTAGPISVAGFTAAVDSFNQITLTGLSIPAGVTSLEAQVTDPTNGQSNQPVVASIVSTAPTPTITASGSVTNPFPTLTINGSGFSAAGTNFVTLYLGAVPLPGAIAPLITGAGQNVTADSATQLTVTLAGPLPAGQIFAGVTSEGIPMAGALVQVATLT